MREPVSLKTLNDHRDPALDGLRGAAVLLVFWFHYGGGLRSHWWVVRLFGYVAQMGWVGVDVFFALSGFLITRLLVNGFGQPHQLRNFFGRRALRILPLYGVAIGLCAVTALFYGAKLSSLRPLLLYALFLQNVPSLVNSALHAPPPLPLHHLWSLAVEEQFYLLWPFAIQAAGTPRRIFGLCLAVFALSCLVRLGLFGNPFIPAQMAQSFAVFLPVRAGALALGGALAVSYGAQPSTLKSLSGTLLVCAAATSFVTYLITGAFAHTLLLNNCIAYVVGLTAIDVTSAAIVGLSLYPNPVRDLLSWSWLRALGRISYGFYVFHILLEPVFDRLGSLLTHSVSGFAYQGARLACAFPLTCLVAWLSFRFLEQPLLLLQKRFPQPAAIRSNVAEAPY